MKSKKGKPGSRLEGNQRSQSGIFPHLFGKASFVDKVVAMVRGKRKKRSSKKIPLSRNLAIAGPGRFYARAEKGRHVLSKNKMQLRYGLLKKFTNVAPFSVTVWAGGAPVSCADLLLVLDGLMRQGYRARVSSVEVTFDICGVPLWRLARELVTRAQIREVSDRHGLATVYIGGPRSPWEARLYRKRQITRVEFILRAAYFRRMGIRRPQDLYALRRASLFDHVSFRVVDQTHGHALPPRIRDPWSSRGVGLPPMLPASIVSRVLRQAGVNPLRWVVPSPTEKLLRKMQRNLIW